MNQNNLIERLRARINKEPWVPGKYPILEEELLAYILWLENNNKALQERVTDMGWRLDTTRWGA